MTESPRKIGAPVEMPRRVIDRKISVAPMMAWADKERVCF
jgi:hypothetical protein